MPINPTLKFFHDDNIESLSVRFESNTEKKDAVPLSEKDFFHVPHRTVRRGINPSPTEGIDYILFPL